VWSRATAASLNVAIFRGMALCGPYVNHVSEAHHYHRQSKKSPEQESRVWEVPSSADFLPWRWKCYVPLKCWFTYGLHSAISQNTATFITTAPLFICIYRQKIIWKSHLKPIYIYIYICFQVSTRILALYYQAHTGGSTRGHYEP
jgi:hypothetical protein